jgi:uncharacterized Zn-binding protein involved in type VI secretion
MSKVAVDDDECLAEGHPSVCTEPAPGDVESSADFTLNGKPIGTHSGSMHFDSHGHSVDPDTGACAGFQTHDVVPDETPDFTHNGEPIMRVGDETDDPGTGQPAYINSSTESGFTHQ